MQGGHSAEISAISGLSSVFQSVIYLKLFTQVTSVVRSAAVSSKR